MAMLTGYGDVDRIWRFIGKRHAVPMMTFLAVFAMFFKMGYLVLERLFQRALSLFHGVCLTEGKMLVIQGLGLYEPVVWGEEGEGERAALMEALCAAHLDAMEAQGAFWSLLRVESHRLESEAAHRGAEAWLTQMRHAQRRSKRLLQLGLSFGDPPPALPILALWLTLSQRLHLEMLVLPLGWWGSMEGESALYRGQKGMLVSLDSILAASSTAKEQKGEESGDVWVVDLAGKAGLEEEQIVEEIATVEAWRDRQGLWKPLLFVGADAASREAWLTALAPRRSRILGIFWG
jgi:hypothetical protein